MKAALRQPKLGMPAKTSKAPTPRLYMKKGRKIFLKTRV
tara:strand:- start:287 stop:403 length:117 start_codon:yes stop_codon:yes gene_type:complete